MKDYIEQAHQTCSTSFHADKISAHEVIVALSAFIATASNLDRIKKLLFYGKGEAVYPIETENDRADNALSYIHADRGAAINIIHGVIGKATEVGEMVEALHRSLNGMQLLDLVNMREEVGDGLWYDALILKACGSGFDETMRINIEKLRKRFPNKFTEYDANNRDLAGERRILEGGG